MNPSEIRELKIIISQLSHYYQRPLSDIVVNMYAEDLQDLAFEEVKSAYENYRRDPKNKFMPLPAQIREVLAPTVSPDAQAREAAARIPEAIRRFGWNQPDESRQFIGELGWRVVERFGGWIYICENLGVELNPLTFQAQTRDLARAQLEYSAAGRLDERPALLQEPAANVAKLVDLTTNRLLR